MHRRDEVRVEFPCGAVLRLRAVMNVRCCRCGGADCPTAPKVAADIWLAMREAELEAARATGDSPARD